MILVSETAQNMKFFLKDFLSKHKKIQQTFHTDNISNISGFIHWIGDDGKMCVCFLEMLEILMLILLAFSFSTMQRSNLCNQVYVALLVLFKRDIFLYQYVNTKNSTIILFKFTIPMNKDWRRFSFEREKIKWNFYFHALLWCLERFYGGLKGQHETFWGTRKQCQNKNLS